MLLRCFVRMANVTRPYRLIFGNKILLSSEPISLTAEC
jgi:hypothetical protein